MGSPYRRFENKPMNIQQHYTTQHKPIPDSSIITGNDLNQKLIQLSDELTTAQQDLKRTALDLAKKEHLYRQAKAVSYLTVKALPENIKATAPTLAALVDKACAEEREAAYIARAMERAALENVKSIRQQLSALQSIA